MKRLLLLLLVFTLTIRMDSQTYETIKVGESISTGWGNNMAPCYGGNAIAVDLLGGNYAKVVGVQPGYATFNAYRNGEYHPSIIFHVLDVIPSDVNLIVGENFTYSPVVNSSNSDYKTFTWTSDNTAVATVDANGKVNAVAPGRAIITCTAKCGNSFNSVVYVSTQIVQEVTLNKNNQDLDVGKTAQLTSTVSPENATYKSVRWLSTNDNIAQVDDEGNVTAIGPGYCTIYAKADDGSGKFVKCLVHVNGTAGVRGDMNGDGQVTVTDASAVIDIILDK